MKNLEPGRKKIAIWLGATFLSVAALTVMGIFSSLETHSGLKMLSYIGAIYFIAIVCVVSMVFLHRELDDLFVKIEEMIAERNSHK
ncbi:MAG: hypothetical protein QG551_160 [Patescibacteria group bacterium]|jgi:amino acid permease|nr:hypothetical protein [Patescibacteria group bacterium]